MYLLHIWLDEYKQIVMACVFNIMNYQWD